MGNDGSARRLNGLGHFIAWLTLLMTILGGVLTVYGRLTRLEALQMESDTDRHDMINRLERIELLMLERAGKP